ncbi:MAG: hypothetical protein WD941_04110 [Opitutus sp.]
MAGREPGGPGSPVFQAAGTTAQVSAVSVREVPRTGPASSEDAGDSENAATAGPTPPGGFEDGEEEAFLAEARERDGPVAAAPSRAVGEVDARPLPHVEDLVKRIPPGVRDALEDLFRARFVTVRRVPERALKP